MKNKNVIIFVAIILVVATLIGIGVVSTKNVGKSQTTITQEEALASLKKKTEKLEVQTVESPSAPIESLTSDIASELPNIDKVYPLTVKGNGDVNIEIFTSPEKGGTGNDAWLNEVAKEFNAQKNTVDGKSISVSIRSIDSGTGTEYIISNVYQPDAFTPSNEFWGEMISSSGVKISKIEDRLVGNVAGFLLTDKAEKLIKEKYKDVTLKTVVEATQNGDMVMGYLNPMSSSTGLNFLVNTLYTYDKENILSSNAIEGFNAFQKNIPFVGFTSTQMKESTKSGALDGFISEYQVYTNDKKLTSTYTFVPFGIRHDNPLYSVGVLTDSKQAVLEKFADFCLNDSSQKLATKYGFNQNDDYKSSMKTPDGSTLTAAQELWKENKDGEQEIIAVFAIDTSGSMEGVALNTLKTSLINSMNYIDQDVQIGLISYNTYVYKNLAIAPFDLTQKSKFKGAVQNLSTTGTTGLYNAIAVGMDMLEDAMKDHPNAKPMLFLLTDGQPSMGTGFLKFKDVEDIISGLNIPVYTIGYGDDVLEGVMTDIANINEAAYINASTDDVVYKLRNLFNAEL